ncbi:MAG: T9SS type A sorting domain-containing protein [Saprospiraceae bacterium]|nr:T9SS type A sorting domain-containing protein [Saprospiraceae bacterium]
MNNFIITLCLCFIMIHQTNAQTYADDIAQIFFDNCTVCHHNGGVAPFSLMTYAEVSSMTSLIQPAVNNEIMPPWPPDNTYSQFTHERSLTSTEISAIDSWINAGAPEGNSANTPAPPFYHNNSLLGQGDFSVRIPDYISKATFGNDDYVCFSIPTTGLNTTESIQAIEVIPGDPSIVHHVLVYVDPTGTYPTDTTSHSCAGPSNPNIGLIAGYAPGSMPSQYPNSSTLKMGTDITPGSNIILAMHYPAGSQGKLDSTRVTLHFHDQNTSGIRNVTSTPILQNTSFVINANTVDSVESWFPSSSTPLPINMSMFSIFPHAHLLGQNFIVYAVNHFPPYDKIPLIHIPKWDFEWQGFYVFKYLQKMPAGYKLYGKAIYDNTTNNPYNPNFPPQNVSFGLNTTDEMFIVYFQYLTYQNGDELINIDSLLQLQTTTQNKPISINENGVFMTTYPNPTNTITSIEYYTKSPSKISLAIYDIKGQRVKNLIVSEYKQGQHISIWDGTNDSGNLVPAGVYFSQLNINSKTVIRKIIRTSK